MSFNTFGLLFRVTTFGESHGPAIGCVVDGCPPGLTLTAEEIQTFLDKRRPGQSRFTSQRREPDSVRILSGVLVGFSSLDVDLLAFGSNTVGRALAWVGARSSPIRPSVD